MLVLKGKGICGGVAFGKLSFYRRVCQPAERRQIPEPKEEIRRFETARAQALEQLGALYEKALPQAGEQGALIFQIHQMMLEDEDYTGSIVDLIRSERVNAEYAVDVTSKTFAGNFSAMDDPYMKERAADVKDISERLMKLLLGGNSSVVSSDTPVIIAAEDLSPSETVQLDKSKILAFLTADGSSNSHTAILARTMGIPAVVGVGEALWEAAESCDAIVDGETGTVYLEPDKAVCAAMRKKQETASERARLLEKLKGKPDVTLDGQAVMIHANIGSLADLEAALRNDAGGIGLFRTEFLYLEKSCFPTEDEQFAVYKAVAQAMAGKRAVIRTLDIGADKQAPYFGLPQEENPALGMRAVRYCLTNPDIFKTQLRAIYRASAFGKIAILFPMITSVDEVRRIREIAVQAQNELSAEGLPFSKAVELGVMIETPAAAVLSDRLAKEADFFSVGTNDLTQYALAVDRQNPRLEPFCDARHEAVLRLIQMAAERARRAGIWIGVCGGLAADLQLTETFLAMGIDELSVPPSSILELRKKIRGTNVEKIRKSALALFHDAV